MVVAFIYLIEIIWAKSKAIRLQAYKIKLLTIMAVPKQNLTFAALKE